jgi:hypothetical protein
MKDKWKHPILQIVSFILFQDYKYDLLLIQFKKHIATAISSVPSCSGPNLKPWEHYGRIGEYFMSVNLGCVNGQRLTRWIHSLYYQSRIWEKITQLPHPSLSATFPLVRISLNMYLYLM